MALLQGPPLGLDSWETRRLGILTLTRAVGGDGDGDWGEAGCAAADWDGMKPDGGGRCSGGGGGARALGGEGSRGGELVRWVVGLLLRDGARLGWRRGEGEASCCWCFWGGV